MHIYPSPPPWTGCDTRSIFKECLNSESSFFYTDCYTKAKELSLAYYLSIDGVGEYLDMYFS